MGVNMFSKLSSAARTGRAMNTYFDCWTISLNHKSLELPRLGRYRILSVKFTSPSFKWKKSNVYN
jgi:hypothetical protein